MQTPSQTLKDSTLCIYTCAILLMPADEMMRYFQTLTPPTAGKIGDSLFHHILVLFRHSH